MTLRPARRATVALVAAVLLALPACSGGSTSAVADQGFISGDGTVTQLAVAERKDPVEFSGTTLDGKPFDLASLRGDVVVVNVWGSWCAPCIAEAPALQKVHEQTEAEGVRFVGINTEDGPGRGAGARAPVRRDLPEPRRRRRAGPAAAARLAASDRHRRRPWCSTARAGSPPGCSAGSTRRRCSRWSTTPRAEPAA